MMRKAFKMTVYRDCLDEYADRHNPIWPELADTLRGYGVSNYSIFVDTDTRTLFGYLEVADEQHWTALSNDPVCRKWWGYMKDLMETNPDDSPVSTDLREVFHLK